MRIEQIKQVLTVAEAGSINRAARALYISQSNLSQSIKSLEDEIGREIFTRQPRGVVLTEFGRDFTALARNIDIQLELLYDFCEETRHKPALTFCAASQYMRFANTLFTELYMKYRERRISFSFLECSFLDIVEHVSSQRAEVGLLLLSLPQKKLTLRLFLNRALVYHPLAVYPAVVTVGPKNPFYSADVKGVTMEDMRPYTLIMYRGTNFNYSAELDTLCPDDRENMITVSDRATMHEFIRATQAYSIAAGTDAYSAATYYENIRALPLLDKNMRFELGYIESQTRPLSAIGAEYVNGIKRLLNVAQKDE